MKEITEFKDRILNDPENDRVLSLVYINREDFVNSMNDLEKTAIRKEIETELDHLECFIACMQMNPKTREYLEMIISRIDDSLEKLV